MKKSSFDALIAHYMVGKISRSRFVEMSGVSSNITAGYNSLVDHIRSWNFEDPKSVSIHDIYHNLNQFESLLKNEIHVNIEIIRYSIELLFIDEFIRQINKKDSNASSVLSKCDNLHKIIKHYRRLSFNGEV